MIQIGNREIGAGCAPFVIAEMLGNRNHSLERALNFVAALAK
jgi:N-acetylneuraminate synthase